MAVTNSYTAHRGESLLTWAAIYDRQRNLERQLLDWLAVKVIERAIERGEIPPFTATATADKLFPYFVEDWRDRITWSLPTMPAINEKESVEAQAASLKAGLATYKDILGSEWDETFDELAREVERIRELGLPVSILETVSGAPAGSVSTSQEDNLE